MSLNSLVGQVLSDDGSAMIIVGLINLIKIFKLSNHSSNY